MTNTISESAFQNVRRGLEEAKAYTQGERESYQVTGAVWSHTLGESGP